MQHSLVGFVRLVVLCACIVAFTGARAAEPEEADAEQETPWPYEVMDGDTTPTVYQPAHTATTTIVVPAA